MFRPNNVTDSTVAPTLLRRFKQLYRVKKSNRTKLLADKAYDAWEIYQTWHTLFGGKAVIPTNPRNTKADTDPTPICQADLDMKFSGAWLDEEGHRKRFKYRCPEPHKDCPFAKSAYRCTAYRQIKEAPPGKVYEFEPLFKELYPKRQGIEQYNAVLQLLGEETPNHFKRKSIENTVLLAVLGTALIAAHNATQHLTDKKPPG